jgi:hypothetical protein
VNFQFRAREKCLQLVRKFLDSFMNNKEKGEASVGHPTVEDELLSAHRDSIVDMLACRWAEVGWQLSRARTRPELRTALEPLNDHPEKYRVARLLLATTDNADAKQIREKRNVNKRAIEAMAAKRTKYQECARWVETAEAAKNQVPSEESKQRQKEAVQAKLTKFQGEERVAREEYDASCKEQQSIERNLDLLEAAYAQDQLLMFIDKRFIKGEYARNPLKLGNAISGLPFAHDVPFMGVWQSYLRCSKLPCDLWPHHQFEVFRTIESIWQKLQEVTMPLVEFFHREIIALPKTVVPKAVDRFTKKKISARVENGVRSYLLDNWPIWSRAIRKSLESPVESERMPFAIGCNFTKIQREPQTKTLVDLVLERREND